MHHLAAFNASLADVTLAQVTAVTDDVLAIQNGNFVLQEPHELIFAAAMSANLQRARISTAKMRVVTTPWIRPIRLAAVPAAEPRVADYRVKGYALREQEEILVEAIQNSGGAQEVTAFIGLRWAEIAMPLGDFYTLRGTSTTAAVADTWTSIAMTWQDALPVGRYAVVGLEVQSTNARAARMILENTYPRPGSISVSGIGDRQHEMFRAGGLGVWGYFNSIRMPTIQVFANAADAVHEVYLTIVRI